MSLGGGLPARRSLKRCGANMMSFVLLAGESIRTGFAGNAAHACKEYRHRPGQAETPTHVVTMAFDPDLDVAAASDLREDDRCWSDARPASPPPTLYSLAASPPTPRHAQRRCKGIHMMLAGNRRYEAFTQQT